MFSKNMDYIKNHVCDLNPLLLVCHKNRLRVNWDKNLNWCNKLYQSRIELAIAWRRRDFPCSREFTGSLLKSERLSCLKSFGRILFCDCRTKHVPGVCPKNCSQKREQKSLSSLLFILLHILDTLYKFTDFFCLSKPIFLPSSSLATLFIASGNCRTFLSQPVSI